MPSESPYVSFPHAHDFHIDTINHYGSNPGKSPLDRLLKHVSHGAIHDSAERGPDAPKCHPETRVAVQQEIMSWIKDGDQDAIPTRIMWLSGPAGSGKTAIAGTVADKYHRKGQLAASFFFSGFSQTPGRRLKGTFLATLAYQLLQHKSIPALREAILSVIEADPTVLYKHLEEQIERLILGPLRKVVGHSDQASWPSMILIDGLDECDIHSDREFATQQDRQRAKEGVHREILATLARAAGDPSFPFRIVVISRPEPAIRNFFSVTSAREVFLDDKYSPEEDIEMYSRAVLTTIGRDYGLQPGWFADDVPRTLAGRASGQFIYAATALRFVQDKTRPPHEQLKRVLKWSRFDISGGNPFGALDALYTEILKTSPDPPLAARWITAIAKGRPGGAAMGAFPDRFAEIFLQTFPGETEYLLGNLTSLIGTSQSTFTLYHQSIVDFLGDKGRSKDLCVTSADAARFDQDRCHHILKNRGPAKGVNLPDDVDNYHQSFDINFCTYMLHGIDPSRNLNYEHSDVDWWWSKLHPERQENLVRGAFIKVHRNCRWFRCLPACTIWRKAILSNCRAESWPHMPTRIELLRDRFKKYSVIGGNSVPLHGPNVERGEEL